MKFKLNPLSSRASAIFYGYEFNGTKPVEVDDQTIIAKLKNNPVFVQVDAEPKKVETVTEKPASKVGQKHAGKRKGSSKWRS